ncbi:hypothetical protein P7K49_025128 [Saguinus oedipus]|uniref:Uncharacterized protein n=1 Tax=Saguinus oedipus TaxID=9490 RepID=A0ABQ9UG76_SAGOE|nr:hypothetical protein P7K49_025128 [Saguinus oedipus]
MASYRRLQFAALSEGADGESSGQIFFALRTLKVPGVGETRDASTPSSCGHYVQFCSAVAQGTKLIGLGALLNRQYEICKGRGIFIAHGPEDFQWRSPAGSQRDFGGRHSGFTIASVQQLFVHSEQDWFPY